MAFWRKLWRGELRLSFTFWRMGVQVWLAFVAFGLLLDILGVYDHIGVAEFWVLFLFDVFVTAYGIFVLVAIWRCANVYIATAKNTGEYPPENGYYARLAVIFGSILILFRVLSLVSAAFVAM